MGNAKDTRQDADLTVSERSNFPTAVEAFSSSEAAPALHPQHPQYFSPRIDAMIRNRSKFPDQVEFDIKSSKVHWSTVERPAERRSAVDMESHRGVSSGRSSSGDEEEEDEGELDEEVLQANRAAMEDQKGHPMWGWVFQGDTDRLVLYV